MNKLIALLGSLFLSSVVLAGSVAHEAHCPQGLAELEKNYWKMILDDPKAEKVVILDQRVDCAVIEPPLSEQDFIKMAMIMHIFTLYPDVVIPWVKMENGNLYMVRASATDRVEFIKIIYAPKNGNLVIGRITLGARE
jgi:hypothetical protein